MATKITVVFGPLDKQTKEYLGSVALDTEASWLSAWRRAGGSRQREATPVSDALPLRGRSQ